MIFNLSELEANPTVVRISTTKDPETLIETRVYQRTDENGQIFQTTCRCRTVKDARIARRKTLKKFGDALQEEVKPNVEDNIFLRLLSDKQLYRIPEKFRKFPHGRFIEQPKVEEKVKKIVLSEPKRQSDIFDEIYRSYVTVRIQNFPKNITAFEVYDLIRTFSKPLCIHTPTEYRSSNTKGHVFITFLTRNEAQKLVDILDNVGYEGSYIRLHCVITRDKNNKKHK
jgi:hypothetical protein